MVVVVVVVVVVWCGVCVCDQNGCISLWMTTEPPWLVAARHHLKCTVCVLTWITIPSSPFTVLVSETTMVLQSYCNHSKMCLHL